jgi:hypothetical protein
VQVNLKGRKGEKDGQIMKNLLRKSHFRKREEKAGQAAFSCVG